jgi:hypothetical protein
VKALFQGKLGHQGALGNTDIFLMGGKGILESDNFMVAFKGFGHSGPECHHLSGGSFMV